jgi:hypothetical protein
MGSSRRPKSTRAKSIRPGKNSLTGRGHRKSTNRSTADVPDIPDGICNEIESQRRALITIATLLRCLHVVLELREDGVCEESTAGAEPIIELAYLPDMTAMALERVHAVHLALDSVSLTNVSKAFGRQVESNGS